MVRLISIHGSALLAAVAAIAAPIGARAAVSSPSGRQGASPNLALASRPLFNPAAPRGSAANPIPENSPTSYQLAYRLTPSDPNLVTNGPIPDTAANRAKYGGPVSQAGRESADVGN